MSETQWEFLGPWVIELVYLVHKIHNSVKKTETNTHDLSTHLFLSFIHANYL